MQSASVTANNIIASAVDVPQIKMSEEEQQRFLIGFQNYMTAIQALSAFDFTASGAEFEYESKFDAPEDDPSESAPAESETDEERAAREKEEEMKRVENRAKKLKNLQDKSGNPLDSKLSIFMGDRSVGQRSSLGKLIPHFPHYCPVCGKEIGGGERWGEYVKLIPIDGYCSFQCATKSLMDFVTNAFMPTLEQDKAWIEDIQAVLNFINSICNIINELPYIMASYTRLPTIYSNYVISKIVWIFTYIKILVNKALIAKNKLIIWILSKIKCGYVGRQVMRALDWINFAFNMINALAEAFETAYGVAAMILQEAMRMFCIDAEGMGFFMTTRSMIISPGQMLMKIDKNANLKISAIDSISVEGILDAVKLSLPPIQEPEYFLDPDAFEVRYLLSDDNYKLAGRVIDTLLPILKFGADYLPTWEHLRPWNPFFIVALAYGWCPATQACFALELGTEIPGVAASYNAKLAAQV